MTTLQTATIGSKVKAALFNAVVAVLTPRGSYSTTVTGFSSTPNAATITSSWWRAGNICHVVIQGKLGTGTASVANTTFTLPLPMDTTGMILNSTLLDGTASFSDVSVGAGAYYGGVIRVVDANTVQVLRPSTTSGVYGVTTGALPFNWAGLDETSAVFSYPIA